MSGSIGNLGVRFDVDVTAGIQAIDKLEARLKVMVANTASGKITFSTTDLEKSLAGVQARLADLTKPRSLTLNAKSLSETLDKVMTNRELSIDTRKSEEAVGRLGEKVKKVGAGGGNDEMARGLLKAAGHLEGIERSMGRLKERAIEFVAAMASVEGLKKASELSTNYQSFLYSVRGVARTPGEMQSQSDALYHIAQKTSQPIAALGGLYTNIAIQTQGRGRNDAMTITENLSKLASIQKSQSGHDVDLTQLMQLLNSGTPTAQELNSIDRTLPVLERYLIMGLNKQGFKINGRKDIEGQALLGNITSEHILTALANQSAPIDNLYRATPHSATASFENVTNSFSQFFGKMDQQAGISASISVFVQGISKQMDDAMADGSFTKSAHTFGLTFQSMLIGVSDFIKMAFKELSPLWDEQAAKAEGASETLGGKLQGMGVSATEAFKAARETAESFSTALREVAEMLDRVNKLVPDNPLSHGADEAAKKIGKGQTPTAVEQVSLSLSQFAQNPMEKINDITGINKTPYFTPTDGRLPGLQKLGPQPAPGEPPLPEQDFTKPKNGIATPAEAATAKAVDDAKASRTSATTSAEAAATAAKRAEAAASNATAQAAAGIAGVAAIAAGTPGAPGAPGAPAAPGAPGAPAAPGVPTAVGAPVSAAGMVSGVPANLLPHYQEAALKFGIPLNLLLAQSKQESRFDPNAVGKAGEVGLMQIMPSTALDPGYGMHGVTPASIRGPENVRANIMFGAEYLVGRATNGGKNPVDWSNSSQVETGLVRYNGRGDPNYVSNIARNLPGGTMAGMTSAPASTPSTGTAGAPITGDIHQDFANLNAGLAAQERMRQGTQADPVMGSQNRDIDKFPRNAELDKQLAEKKSGVDFRQSALFGDGGPMTPYLQQYQQERQASPALNTILTRIEEAEEKFAGQIAGYNAKLNKGNPAQQKEFSDVAISEARNTRQETQAKEFEQKQTGSFNQYKEVARQYQFQADDMNTLTKAYAEGDKAIQYTVAHLDAERSIREIVRYLPKEQADALRQQASAQADLTLSMDKTKEVYAENKAYWQGIGSAVESAAMSVATGKTKIKDALHSLVETLAQVVLKRFVWQPLQMALGDAAGSFSGSSGMQGGSGAGDGNIFSALFRAVGILGKGAVGMVGGGGAGGIGGALGGGDPFAGAGIGSGGGLGGVLGGGAIADPFGGAGVSTPTFAAVGGDVLGGVSHMVGEGGPEIFIPGQNGSIVPAHVVRAIAGGALSGPSANDMRSMLANSIGGNGGGSMEQRQVVQNTFNITTPSPAAFMASKAQMAAKLGDATRSAMRIR